MLLPEPDGPERTKGRAQHGPRDIAVKGGIDCSFQSHQTIKRTGPNPSLYYIISFADLGFPGSLQRCSSYPHIRPPLSHPITPLRPQRTPSVFSLPALFVRPSFLSLILLCIFLIVQSICSPFNSLTWAPFAVVLRFVLSPSFSYSLLIFPSKVIDFDADVNLFHFMLLRCVGKGAFGKVPFLGGYPNLLTNQTLFPGSRRSTQTDTRLVCPQIH